MQQIAPGFVTRQIVPCRACKGRGEIINGIYFIYLFYLFILFIYFIYLFYLFILFIYFIYFVIEKDKCKTCLGDKVVNDRKILEVINN